MIMSGQKKNTNEFQTELNWTGVFVCFRNYTEDESSEDRDTNEKNVLVSFNQG